MTTGSLIQQLTRVCSATGRTLNPGEKYVSVLQTENGQFVRKDYSAANWPGAPPDAIAVWSGKVPAVNQKPRLTIDDELLMECFERLAEESEPSRIQFRYVLGLLLLRRRRLRFEDIRRDSGLEFLHLQCPRTGTKYDVLDPHLGEEDMARVQAEVFKVLGWE